MADEPGILLPWGVAAVDEGPCVCRWIVQPPLGGWLVFSVSIHGWVFCLLLSLFRAMIQGLSAPSSGWTRVSLKAWLEFSTPTSQACALVQSSPESLLPSRDAGSEGIGLIEPDV